ncbi:metal ABC transporter permease [Chachezhania sediminis]|uniref:metal ABC transporter permease n=1 Tax=Chachezhania sediminis TaxID=2599291 RepID=UPI00131B91C8|nr:metal ABC transporter permease [Chachezhania sediminis]
MLDDFFLRALLAALGVALAAAPMGCFVVWRRMAYFGDATAHAGILGIALALATDMPPMPAVLIAALAMASAATALTGRARAMDTALGVLAHSALAAGLVAVALLGHVRLDLMSYLFGDILAVSKGDLVTIWVGAALVLALLVWRWNPLLAATLSPDLARAAGRNPRHDAFGLTLALAIVVAVALKVVGVLLITALLILPAAAARPLVRTPEAMALVATVLAVAAAIGGLELAFAFDTPAGPSIVCTAAGLFVVTTALAGLIRALGRRTGTGAVPRTDG